MHYGRDDRAGAGPKWQRGRIVRVDRDEDTVALGALIWVLGEPETCDAPHCIWCEAGGERQSVYRETSIGRNIMADFIELIPEFTQAVVVQTPEEFLAECRKEQEPHA